MSLLASPSLTSRTTSRSVGVSDPQPPTPQIVGVVDDGFNAQRPPVLQILLDAHAWLQTKFAQRQVDLGDLGLFQRHVVELAVAWRHGRVLRPQHFYGRDVVDLWGSRLAAGPSRCDSPGN